MIGERQGWQDVREFHRPFRLAIKDTWKRLGLGEQFETVDSVIDEIKCILCIEHTSKARIITPLVGKQLKICEIYGLDVPNGCALKRNTVDSKTGRKNKNGAQD